METTIKKLNDEELEITTTLIVKKSDLESSLAKVKAKIEAHKAVIDANHSERLNGINNLLAEFDK